MSGAETRHGAIRIWFFAPPANIRGFIWILLSTFSFMAMVMLVRHLSDRYNTGELAFWRASLGLLLAPIFLRRGQSLFRTRQFDLHLVRNSLHFVGVAGWFYAISTINLSVGMSLQFTVPLFTIVLAILILRERDCPRLRRCPDHPAARHGTGHAGGGRRNRVGGRLSRRQYRNQGPDA